MVLSRALEQNGAGEKSHSPRRIKGDSRYTVHVQVPVAQLAGVYTRLGGVTTQTQHSFTSNQPKNKMYCRYNTVCFIDTTVG